MKSVQLPDCQPDHIGINSAPQLFSQSSRSLRGGRLSIAALPHQGRRLIEAVCLVPVHVINQSFVVQLSDYQIIGSSLGKASSVCHSEKSALFRLD
jgi:pyruvate kinase